MGPDGTLWVLLINRDVVTLEAEVTVAGSVVAGTAPVFRFDGANPLAPVGSVAVADTGTTFTLALPARSVSLVVVDTPSGLLFANGFESGDTSSWSAIVP